MTLSFAGTARFEIVRGLGRGGMGVVFEAFDREQASTCALKLLPHAAPRALLRFKREFRSLQDLRHPNLLSFGELLHDGDHWFFTMELVRGVDLLAYVCGEAARGPPEATGQFTMTLDDARHEPLPSGAAAEHRFDEAKLTPALAQLVEGLACLHEAGKTHRDVKPSNVLVTEAGRVVLLDFGLVTERERDDAPPSMGTPGYMAPEQARGEVAGPPADLYAVGVILHRALTGEPPASASSVPSLLLRRPAPPSAIARDVPPLLDDLCVRLLDPDPHKRPTAREVLETLGAARDTTRSPSPPRFVGRRAEREAIAAAYAEHTAPIVVAIDGPSGIGKSALLAELVAEFREREGSLVLTGRCYEHEGIPYKAVDGVMDALGDHLAREPALELPEDVSLLGVLFPALGRIAAFVPSDAEVRGQAAYELRRRAEHAGRSLFATLTARHRVVVVIDDFQWSDPDSRAFVAALVRDPDAPPILLVLASRTRTSASFDEAETRSIALTPLEGDDARALALGLLESAGATERASPDAIAAEAGGNPFFMGELVWRAASPGGERVRLEDVLLERVAGFEGPMRDVLELAAIAAAPLSQAVVAEAAGLDAGTLARAAHQLRDARLVRTCGVRLDAEIETYHDRVREAVVGRLDDRTRAARHLRLAEVIERRRPDDLDALVTHFESGGEAERAAKYAIHAGDRAARALAFERAASFYRRAIAGLRVDVTRREGLWTKLADALANAGLGAEAAAAYEHAAGEADGKDALELRRRAAEHLLRSGRLDDGLAALSTILEQVGVRVARTPIGAFASIALRRARVRLRGFDFRRRDAAEIAPLDAIRVDTLWAAAARLGPIDTIRAADLQARHLLESLELGEPFRIARALMAEASFVSAGGPARTKNARDLLARADRIVRRIDDPYASAMFEFATGFSDYQFGLYRSGRRHLARAAELFATTCTGASHDVAVSKRFELDCVYNLGELEELRVGVHALLDDAERRGDLYLAVELRTGAPNVIWLAADRPDEARRATERGIAPWSKRGFYLQHYYHALAGVHIGLYAGDASEAHRTIEETWPRLRRSLLSEVQAVRAEALQLRARAAIAHGTDAALAIAARTATKLARERIPAARGLSLAAQAGIAARSRNYNEAASLLRRAASELERADLGMWAAACRRHLGERTERRDVLEAAESWMRERGVVRPDRFADLLVPGFARR